MKQLFRLLACFFIVGYLNVHTSSASIHDESHLNGSVVKYGNCLQYSFVWTPSCLEEAKSLYGEAKLSIVLESYFVVEGKIIKSKKSFSKTRFEGEEIYDPSLEGTFIALGYTQIPKALSWQFEVKATLFFNRDILLQQSTCLSSSSHLSDPLQFLDLTLCDLTLEELCLASEEKLDLVRQSSLRNRVVLDIFYKENDSSLVSNLNQLPQDDPLTFYLKALRVARMPYSFTREDDPNLHLNNDAIITPADTTEIRQLRIQLECLKDEAIIAKELFDEDSLVDLALRIENVSRALEQLERGESAKILSFSASEAIDEYLARCFELDSSFVRIALLDSDIPRDVLKHVMY